MNPKIDGQYRIKFSAWKKLLDVDSEVDWKKKGTY